NQCGYRIPLGSEVPAANELPCTIRHCADERSVFRQIFVSLRIIPSALMHTMETNHCHQSGVQTGTLRGIIEVPLGPYSDHRPLHGSSPMARCRRKIDQLGPCVDASVFSREVQVPIPLNVAFQCLRQPLSQLIGIRLSDGSVRTPSLENVF